MEIIAFKEAISRIELDLQARVLTVTSKGRQTAPQWVNWRVPLARSLLPLVDYEQLREEAKTNHTPVELDYYRFTIALRKGPLTSSDLYWMLADKWGLTVQALAHLENDTMGLIDKQWLATIKARVCPEKLEKIHNNPD
ncbi:hypothetical protein PI125_g21647 [Phytophthora idaei]|nr:hypothetical protein PI125_g21647 [Phytophthora idaei]